MAVKSAILARSGIYVYSREETLKAGIKPLFDKPEYREYRPASVLIAAKDKFDLVPVPREHPPSDVNEHNFRMYASGVIGGPIEVVLLEDGEVGLRGNIGFFTREAYDYYNLGCKETSACMTKRVRQVEDPDSAGYDWVVSDIETVNHVCVTRKGRGGEAVRVLDSIACLDKIVGGTEMGKVKGGFLSFLGIGKPKEDGFKFSAVLMDGVAKVHSLDAAGLEKEVAGVMNHVATLGDSEARDLLAGAVADCFKHPVEVIAQKDAVSEKVDMLYEKCRTADAEAVERIIGSADGASKEKGEDGGAEKKGKDDTSKGGSETEEAAKSKDSVDVDAIVKAVVEQTVSAMDSKIEDAVKKSLGLSSDDKSKPKVPPVSTGGMDDSVTQEDAQYLVRGIFGVR